MPTPAHTSNSAPFAGVREYVSNLHALASEPAFDQRDWETRCLAALNGEASRELRRIVPIGVRRRFGAFFTGTTLSERLISCSPSVGEKAVFFDPTCGMGDLLLAVAKILPLGKSLKQTLKVWGSKLGGTDLHSEFVEGAKARLMLLARQRHGISGFMEPSEKDYFPHIRTSNGLTEYAGFKRATHLLMNPPFGAVAAPPGCKWAGGRITEAATFIIAALERIKPGTEVLAILPEVLRSGSFSDHWRNRVSELAEVHLVKTYGIFDKSADVDVFLLRLIRRHDSSDKINFQWPQGYTRSQTTVAAFFNVHVGRVVPHRDKEEGPLRAYIHPRSVPTWVVVKKFKEKRRHSGRVYSPPFVVIRRTSRPGHPHRAAATIIGGNNPVAVENHLIVCEPKDGKFETCERLMEQLKMETVNEFLNDRIRCRHLTVGAVSEIPFTLSSI